ncbi:hypothetical protein C7437_1262 [Psychrobacillus insolitus]|uniref:Uncharacterized protein n=1 Tax=Psychrobacillus insolitus TaxID=1461 RepID=A0A2W7M945_9BACI|nr:hypothetical protein C7437_1262 [Psychrobacillus insolitus]
MKRMADELKVSHDHIINHKRMQRLLNMLNIKSKIGLKSLVNRREMHKLAYVYSNLLGRDFNDALVRSYENERIGKLNKHHYSLQSGESLYIISRIILFKYIPD